MFHLLEPANHTDKVKRSIFNNILPCICPIIWNNCLLSCVCVLKFEHFIISVVRSVNCQVNNTQILSLCFGLIVNLHRSTRTNEYAGMQMFLTTNLKRDWSAYFNTYLLSKTKTRANENLICRNSLHPVYHTRQLNMDYVQGSWNLICCFSALLTSKSN